MKRTYKMVIVGFTLVLLLQVQANAGQVHRVQAGESLTQMARDYGVSLGQLVSENKYLRYLDELACGQLLVIPEKEQKEVKTSGQTDGAKTEPVAPEPANKETARDGENGTVSEEGSGAYAGLDSTTVVLAKLFDEFNDIVFLSGPSKSNKIALTFDDGPTEVTSSQVLDILQRYNVKGTFFLLGQYISECPEVVARIAREGHVVAGHSWSHVQLEKASLKRIRNEVLGTENAIYQITGKRPALVRPPYGSLNREGLEYLKENGYTVVNWSVDSLDWKYSDNPNQVIISTLRDVRGGSIILFHTLPGRERSRIIASVLPEIIHSLQSQGYQFVTVDQLLSIPAYK